MGLIRVVVLMKFHSHDQVNERYDWVTGNVMAEIVRGPGFGKLAGVEGVALAVDAA